MERDRGVLISVTFGIRYSIRPHRTRVLHQPREPMRVFLIAALLVHTSCNQIPIQTERKTIPIVDKRGEIHMYRSSNPLELGNDYALYCMEHHHWETISVRYQPAPLAKLRYEEYTVRKHPKSS